MIDPPRCTRACPFWAIWQETGVLQDSHYWYKPGQGGYLAHTQELEQRLNAPRPRKPLQTSLWVRIQKLEEFAHWVANLDDEALDLDRRGETLTEIIGRAQGVLSD